MTDRQIAKKNAYAKLLIFFSANASVWATFKKLADFITLFPSKVAAIDAALQGQQATSTGITADKTNAFNALAELVVKYSRKARVWAEDNQNQQLEQIFDVQKYTFSKVSEQEAVQRMVEISTALNANITPLKDYNVLPANVTEINNSIAAYKPLMGTPGASRATKKAFTKQLSTLFNDADQLLYKIDDLLIHEYETTNPTLVDSYRNDRRIDDISGPHNGVDVHVVDDASGDDLQGVLIELEGTTKSVTTDINGEGEIIQIKNATYYLKATLAGYQPHREKIVITKGNVLHLIIKMLK